MSSIKLFENKQVRSQWDEERQTWFFSIVDIVGVLTDSPNPRTYWSVLKTRLKKEGSELATNCSQLKMRSADGKQYLTDVADTEQLLRLVQSIPSPKAEPFKQWLARVGYERIEETEDPELAFDRAMETYLISSPCRKLQTTRNPIRVSTMLTIQAHYHDGHIQISTEGLPRDAKVVVDFLAADAKDAPSNLNAEQQAALSLQSQCSFAQTVLINPAEDCWNNA